ncbi:hypothetical protein VTI28DRAFT_5565 [Corynascus sepedonium]
MIRAGLCADVVRAAPGGDFGSKFRTRAEFGHGAAESNLARRSGQPCSTVFPAMRDVSVATGAVSDTRTRPFYYLLCPRGRLGLPACLPACCDTAEHGRTPSCRAVPSTGLARQEQARNFIPPPFCGSESSTRTLGPPACVQPEPLGTPPLPPVESPPPTTAPYPGLGAASHLFTPARLSRPFLSPMRAGLLANRFSVHFPARSRLASVFRSLC